MAQQAINRGTVAGDGTGESLFDAFGKVNGNFTDLDGRSPPTPTAGDSGKVPSYNGSAIVWSTPSGGSSGFEQHFLLMGA